MSAAEALAPEQSVDEVRESLSVTEKGQPANTIGNCRTVFCHDPPRKRPVKRKISEELRYRQAEQKCFRVLCDYLHLLERWEKEYAPQTPEETWNPLFVEALQKKPYTEYLLDILLSGSMEERACVVAEYGKEVRKIEQRISEFTASHPAGRHERSRSLSAGAER